MLGRTLLFPLSALTYRRFLFLVFTAGSLSSCTPPLGGTPASQNYNCGDLTSGHCYSEANLGLRVTGFRSTITVASNFYGGRGFVTNEFWLANTDGNWGWIEIGYMSNAVQRTKYFYSVLNPETGLFQSHDIDTVPAAEIGTQVVCDVHQTGDSTFAVSLDGNVTHFQATVVVPLWSGNFGGTVNVGQELAKDSGAVASLAEFVYNQVYDAGFHIRYATEEDNASEDVAKPPFGGWMQKPVAGNKGGVFATYCCAP